MIGNIYEFYQQPKHTNSNLNGLLLQLLSYHPLKTPSTAQIIKHMNTDITVPIYEKELIYK